MFPLFGLKTFEKQNVSFTQGEGLQIGVCVLLIDSGGSMDWLSL